MMGNLLKLSKKYRKGQLKQSKCALKEKCIRENVLFDLNFFTRDLRSVVFNHRKKRFPHLLYLFTETEKS